MLELILEALEVFSFLDSSTRNIKFIKVQKKNNHRFACRVPFAFLRFLSISFFFLIYRKVTLQVCRRKYLPMYVSYQTIAEMSG